MPQPNPLTIGDVLDKAADRLSKPGAWAQGSLRSRKRMCAVDAITDTSGNAWEVVCALREHLGIDSISAWNDAPERTQTEVVQTLREAAAKARESAQ